MTNFRKLAILCNFVNCLSIGFSLGHVIFAPESATFLSGIAIVAGLFGLCMISAVIVLD